MFEYLHIKCRLTVCLVYGVWCTIYGECLPPGMKHKSQNAELGIGFVVTAVYCKKKTIFFLFFRLLNEY